MVGIGILFGFIIFISTEIKDTTPANVGRVERSSIVRSTSLYVTYKKLMQYNRELILKIKEKREKQLRENNITRSEEQDLAAFTRSFNRIVYGLKA